MKSLFQDLTLKDSCFKPGNTLCRGCMESIAFNNVGKATDNGKKTIFTMGTFCGEVSTLAWPTVVAWGRGDEPPDTFEKSFGIIHNVFESAPTVAEAVRDVADHLSFLGALAFPVNVVSNSGDGGALAIGLRSLLHTIHRRSRITIVVLINEVFANTGFQYGPTATLYSDTATTPAMKGNPGNPEQPLDHLGLAVLAGAGFVAQVSPAFPKDFAEAVTKALDCRETSVLFVPSPCVSGWKYDDGRTVELAKLSTRAGFFPLFLKEKGKPGSVRMVDSEPRRRSSILKFMGAQRRFSHLVSWKDLSKEPTIVSGAESKIDEIQSWIAYNVRHLEEVAALS